MSDLSEPETYGGVLDDLKTARQWAPILPLLKEFEDANGTVDNLKAIEEVAAFCITVGLNEKPYRNRAFLIFAKFIELIEKDPEWKAIFEGMIK